MHLILTITGRFIYLRYLQVLFMKYRIKVTQTHNDSSSISFEHIAPACPVCCSEREQVEEKKITALLLELISNKEYDRETSKVCNEIIKTGTFGSALNKTSIQASSYLLDLLEIGASKYTQLKKLLKQENIIFPSYRIISQFRQEISLTHSILFVHNPEGHSIGVTVPYYELVGLTIQRHLLNSSRMLKPHSILYQFELQTVWTDQGRIQVSTKSTPTLI